MGDILALGITHYPGLAGEDQRMAGLLKRLMTNPNIPAEMRDPANWPDEMRKEWGNDDGASSAARHREGLVGWMMKTRAALDAFKPDFVLIWGDDQYENFREDIIPPYCVNAYDKFEFHSPPNNIWGESVEKTFTLQGVPKVGRQMATHLLEDGFDCAYAYKPLHHNLGHAFANAIMYLDYNRVGFPYPILPVAINCYGRRVISQRGGGPSLDRVLSADELDPPAPTPKRLFDMGGSIARFLKDSPYRVAILASSGWSHAFLTEKNYFLWPDTPADRKLYNALRDGDYQTWRNYPAAAIEDSGQQEVLNWMCLAGAMNELKMKPSTAETGMLTTWIFNSSKTFMINPKQAA